MVEFQKGVRAINKYTAILTYNPDDGWWTATCAEVPAAIGQGRTCDEARDNLGEAILLVVEPSEPYRDAAALKLNLRW